VGDPGGELADGGEPLGTGKGAKAEFTAAVPVTITDKQGKALPSAAISS